jgi:hypothetical protein
MVPGEAWNLTWARVINSKELNGTMNINTKASYNYVHQPTPVQQVANRSGFWVRVRVRALILIIISMPELHR